jgi:hypothetical protein
MRDLFPNARNLFVVHQVILFSAASESKPSIFYARGQIFCAERARGKISKSFQKSASDAHTISRVRVAAKAQGRNLPMANLS